MPHAVAGFEVFGLIRSVIGIIAAIAFIWLAYKLGKLADVYMDRPKAKLQ